MVSGMLSAMWFCRQKREITIFGWCRLQQTTHTANSPKQNKIFCNTSYQNELPVVESVVRTSWLICANTVWFRSKALYDFLLIKAIITEQFPKSGSHTNVRRTNNIESERLFTWLKWIWINNKYVTHWKIFIITIINHFTVQNYIHLTFVLLFCPQFNHIKMQILLVSLIVQSNVPYILTSHLCSCRSHPLCVVTSNVTHKSLSASLERVLKCVSHFMLLSYHWTCPHVTFVWKTVDSESKWATESVIWALIPP